MTEIPEHLLKRSRDRRAALGGDSGGSDEAPAAAASAPATTTGATPAPAAPAAPAGRGRAPAAAAAPPPKPDSPVVAAYKRRAKIPFWAMLGLCILPIWAFMYARAVTTQAREATGPLGEGAEIYTASCQSCHGGAGEGSVGYALANGEVNLTFPHIEDQLRFVYFGSDEYEAAGVDSYGDPDREGGPHLVKQRNGAAMPGQNAAGLTDAEILAVVCHERYGLGGPEQAGEEFETWCSEESEIFADLEEGGDLRTVAERFDGVLPIGDAPVPGSPAGE